MARIRNWHGPWQFVPASQRVIVQSVRRTSHGCIGTIENDDGDGTGDRLIIKFSEDEMRVFFDAHDGGE